MVTTAYVQGIFNRHHWSHQTDANGNVRSNFNGVNLIVFMRENGVLVASIAFHAEGSDRQAIRTHRRDLELVLAAINSAATTGYFEYDANYPDEVFYSTYVAFTGNMVQDDPRLVQAIARNVAASEGVGPMIAALIRGQITTQQALEAIAQAVRDSTRGRGVA